ncbi:MAG: cation:proton antiporter [Acidobacteria bacterium RIFCSPLOWO2_02_FULL_59_13]|nr:MAG: cation:proton antiporter [Acidobacteria bacterium RIFCSPLOWO2_02_FULL_59_13]
MNMILWNILIAIAWAILTEQFTLENLLLGFVLGLVILWFLKPWIGSARYFAKLRLALEFFFYFLKELVLANLRVAYDVVTPTHYMRPGVIALPLEARTDAEITMLANLISLTPGTLSLDISVDRKILYIHAMYIHDIEALRCVLKNGMERRVLEMLR